MVRSDGSFHLVAMVDLGNDSKMEIASLVVLGE